MKKKLIVTASVCACAGLLFTYSAEPYSTASATIRIIFQAEKPAVYIISPADGAMVSNPVTIKFGVRNFGVAPAEVLHKNTGHHHLIVDAPLPEITQPIPFDEHHIHFNGGETETQVELAAGKHTLQLLLGDFSHTPHSRPLYSDVITVTVQ